MPEVLQTLTDLYAAHGYWVLFVAVLLENAGIPGPGETAVLAAGYLCSLDGGHRMSAPTVAALASLAAIIGDNCGYWLGRSLARPRLDTGRRFLFLTPARMTVAEGYFRKYGMLTIFAARFVTLLRVIAGPAAGAARMSWWRFATANAVGAVVWACLMTALGFYFGHAWAALRKWMGWGAWAVVGVVIVGVVAWRVLRSRRQQ